MAIEKQPYASDNEPTPEHVLNKGAVLDKLFDLRDEFGLDIEEADIQDYLGQDDNDFLGNLATLALMHGLDHEDFFTRIGVPAERVVEIDNETE